MGKKHLDEQTWNITQERSLTDLRARGRLGVKISSADLDPAFEPAKSQHFNDYFQTVAFDPNLGGTDPHQYEHGVENAASTSADDNEDGLSTLNEAVQALGKDAFIVQVVRGERPRDDTPEWIQSRNQLSTFILSRIAESDKAARRVPLSTKLDFIILVEFYLSQYTDEEIFHYYYRLLEQDKARTRWTCSPTALKARRERLVKSGDRFFDSKIEKHDNGNHARQRFWSASHWSTPSVRFNIYGAKDHATNKKKF